MAKQGWFDSSSPCWAEALALVDAMKTAACYGVIEKARLAAMAARMLADSRLDGHDRGVYVKSLAKMFHEGILRS